MFCKNCGKPLNPQQVICLNCGTQVGNGHTFCWNCGNAVYPNAPYCGVCGVANQAPGAQPFRPAAPQEADSNSIGWWWLGFLVPIVGFILYAIQHDTTPMKAKKLLNGAIVGLAVSVGFSVLSYVFYFLIFMML